MLYCNGLFIVCGFGGSPEDRSFILPLKSAMGFAEAGTLDPVTSHLTDPCQAASTSSHKTARPAWPILLAGTLAASISSLGGWWGHVEGEQSLLPGAGEAQGTASEPRNIPSSLQNLLPGAPRCWALYQMVWTSYPTIWPSLTHHHVMPVWGPPLPTEKRAVFALH